MSKWTTFLLIFVLLFPAGPVFGQTLEFADVEIRGDQRVEKSAIRSVISVRPGRPASMEEIDRDIREIYRLGRFQDVTAEIEEYSGAKTLIYRVQERPLVREVRFEGNDEFADDKFTPQITIKTPDLYDPREVQKSIQAIKDVYVEEGYYAAEIDSEVDVNEANEATVIFVIEEGEKVLVDAISFEGNTVFADEELRDFMETKERWFLSWLTGRGTYKEEVLELDLEIMADQYYNQGYVQVKVKRPIVELSEDRKYMDVHIEIEEGAQYRVGSIDVRGELLENREEHLALIKLKAGEVFDRSQLREDIFALNSLYADRGYAFVNVAPLTQLDHENNLVNLIFDIERGVQVNIERINISGNSKTRDKVIRREMELVEGDLFSASKIKESRRRINNLGFFEEVNVTTSKATEEDRMNVDVDVKERGTGTFSLGFGYSSVDKFVGQGSIQQDNFLGRALKLNLSGSFGGSSTTYQFGLTDPYFLDAPITLGFDLYNIERDWTDFSKKARGGDIKIGAPLTADKKIRAFFLYRYEEKEIFEVDAWASRFIRDQEGESTLSSITATLTRDTTDYRMDPTEGGMSKLTLEFAGLGGTEKFIKYVADHRHFIPFKWETYFSLHGEIGYIQDIGEDIPLDERFFLGGINTLRGFPSREVGPQEDGDFIGGVKEAYFNFEYIFPIFKDMGLKGLVFYDIGNAWGSDEDYFSDMRHNVGAGVRWFSPMGPLRLEWGYNLDPRDDEDNSQFQFSIGRFF